MATSQAEIWDDSALIESWNDALKEYKKYHSIEARRENPAEVLASFDKTPVQSGEIKTDDEQSNQVPLVALTNSTAGESENHGDNEKIPGCISVNDEAYTNNKGIPIPSLPQFLVGQVHDEGLKNLLMSWYYAGYYTGLYEGQHHT